MRETGGLERTLHYGFEVSDGVYLLMADVLHVLQTLEVLQFTRGAQLKRQSLQLCPRGQSADTFAQVCELFLPIIGSMGLQTYVLRRGAAGRVR